MLCRKSEIALLLEEMRDPQNTAQGMEILSGLLEGYKNMTDAEFNDFMKVCEL